MLKNPSKIDELLNWKTTAAGLILATSNIVVAYLHGTLNTKTFLLSFFMAVLGYFAKDATKSGTVSKPRF